MIARQRQDSGYQSCIGLLLLALTLAISAGCVPKSSEPSPLASLDPKQLAQNPLTPEENQELMKELGESWFYGQGLGETALAVGTVALFPPYALVLAGNAVLELSGYETVSVFDFVPPEQSKAARSVYDEVTSAPGRATASIAGREFHDKETIAKKLEPYTERYQQQVSNGDYLAEIEP